MKFSKRYDSIDNLPIGIWNRIHQTGLLGNLIIKRTDCPNYQFLEDTWEYIYNEYLYEFGLTNDYKDIIRLKKSIALNQAKYILDDNRVILNDIYVDEKRLEELKGKNKDGKTLTQCLQYLEKQQGIRLRENDVTVKEYFNYLKNNG